MVLPEGGPSFAAWGMVEVLCGFCDLNYKSPPGSGELQPIVSPVEFAAAGAVTRSIGLVAGRSTTLFRVVDDVELGSIVKTGRFSASPNGDTVKRFLGNFSDAKKLQKTFSEFFGVDQHIVRASAPKEAMQSATRTSFSDVPGTNMTSVNIPSRLVDKVICTVTRIKGNGC